MLTFAFKRLLVTVSTLLVLAALVFVLLRAAAVDAAYPLDEPGRAVNDLVAAGLSVSLPLCLAALLLAVLAGCGLGVLAALRRGTLADRGLMALAMAGVSIPNFVVAPLLILAFALALGWGPAGDWGGAVLPVIALALPQLAWLARRSRDSMVEVLAQNDVLRHALKPALMPLLACLGPATAQILAGSVVVEQVFSIPGVGRQFVHGALNGDYALVMGVVMLYGALVVLLSFAADLLRGALDPRVQAG